MTPSHIPCPLPQVAQLQAPSAWHAIDFISDLHLSAVTPKTFAAWEAHLRYTDADAVLILGDLFEVWIGDDSRHNAFEARCTQVLAASSSQRKLAFMAGNRDFLIGEEMLRACGMSFLPDPTLLVAFEQQILLTHGDMLCLSDTEYQQFRQHVRNDAWQKDFLALPTNERLAIARNLRDQSEARKLQMPSPENWADVDCPAAISWLASAGANVMVHGHTHRPGSQAMAPGYIRHVLSDWDMDEVPHRAEVLRLTASGFQRIPPATGAKSPI